MSDLTLGSLFDGSGGFPLGGMLAGIKPLWSSEIEPFPIRVTEKRLPGVRHYGDISQLNGAELPPVDIITFGSPCQDLSIAGKRSGLSGARSSLFFEAIRIIKEMRGVTNGKYPRYMECPREENVSFLSQILMPAAPEKYYLSRRACLHILRAASAHGKELPPLLKTALERQAERLSSLKTTHRTRE